MDKEKNKFLPEKPQRVNNRKFLKNNMFSCKRQIKLF